jgi:hypothetical protein
MYPIKKKIGYDENVPTVSISRKKAAREWPKSQPNMLINFYVQIRKYAEFSKNKYIIESHAGYA